VSDKPTSDTYKLLSDRLRELANPDTWGFSDLGKLTDLAEGVSALEREIAELRDMKDRAEQIQIKAHMAADHYAYDLMKSVLPPEPEDE
jgi:hypothetical protein